MILPDAAGVVVTTGGWAVLHGPGLVPSGRFSPPIPITTQSKSVCLEAWHFKEMKKHYNLSEQYMAFSLIQDAKIGLCNMRTVPSSNIKFIAP